MQNLTNRGLNFAEISSMRRPSEEYVRLGNDFQRYHKDSATVILYFITTPLRFMGAISLLRRVTNSSSIAVSIMGLYLLSLLPIVPSGDFYGTALFCGFTVLVVRHLKLGVTSAVTLIVIGVLMQNLSHLVTLQQLCVIRGDGGIIG